MNDSGGALHPMCLNCKPRRAARNTSAARHALPERRWHWPPWDSGLSSVGYGAGLSHADNAGLNRSGRLPRRESGRQAEEMGRAKRRRSESFRAHQDRNEWGGGSGALRKEGSGCHSLSINACTAAGSSKCSHSAGNRRRCPSARDAGRLMSSAPCLRFLDASARAGDVRRRLSGSGEPDVAGAVGPVTLLDRWIVAGDVPLSINKLSSARTHACLRSGPIVMRTSSSLGSC